MNEQETIKKLLSEYYNIDHVVELKHMHGWMDQTFYAESADGRGFVFKIFRDPFTCDVNQIEAEIAMINHLRLEGYPVPEIIPTVTDGKFYGSDPFKFRLSKFLKGELVDRTYSPQLCGKIGEVAGKIDQSLMNFKHTFYETRDDANMLMKFSEALDTRQLIEKLQDDHQKELARRYVALYDEKITSKLSFLPVQVIHTDMHGRNLIADKSYSEVVGIIDFSDARKTLRIIEPAVALVGILISPAIDLSACVEAFLKAYCSQVHLTKAEKEALPVAIIGRLVLICSIFNLKALESKDDEQKEAVARFEKLYGTAWLLVEQLLRGDTKLSLLFRTFADDQ